ncbi:glycine-rich RNA-binding protein 4, mitochondrial [Trifolium repens]|nr:glycine-rich RNA-binding protein 4, mitochondrial [Trifolium repens]
MVQFLNIHDLVYPSVFNFPLLEETNIDYGYDDNMFKESLLIDWLQLLANSMIMYIDFRTLSLIHQIQKKYPTHSIVPCFVRLKSLMVKWRSDSQIFDEVLRGGGKRNGVSYSTDEQSLREVFSKYGEVVDVRIITDRETGQSKGFGFITYNTIEEASSAIQALDGQDLHGRRVGVNFANERPRGYGGGYGGGFEGPVRKTSYDGGDGYGNSTYSAPSSGGEYGGNVPGGYGGYGSTYNDGTTSGGYGANNVNYGAAVGGGERNTVNYGSPPGVGGYGGNNTNYGAAVGGGESNTVNYGTPAVGGYGGNNVSYGAADTVNYGSAPGVGGYGGGNNATYGAAVGGGESNSVNYGTAPGVGGYGGGNNANYGAAVGGGDSNFVNYGTAPADGGYGAAVGFGNSTPGSGPSNGFASGPYPGNETGYGIGSSGTGSSFAGGYDKSVGGLGYGESGQENFRSNDHEVDAFAKRG